jgi:hypothetical protein
MTNKEWLLKIAREVENDPSRWTQHAVAKDKDGIPVEKIHTATCWCAMGFIRRDNHDNMELRTALRYGNNAYIVDINDNLSSPAEFVAWFREVAALLD